MKNIVGFEYKFSSLSDILNSSKKLGEFGILDYIIIILLIAFVVALVLYVIPFINHLLDKRAKSIKSRNRRNLLLKIKTQKEIEDEIDEEMKAEEQAKLEARNKSLNYKSFNNN